MTSGVLGAVCTLAMELCARPFFVHFLQVAIGCTSLEILSEVFDRGIEKMSGWHISRPKDSRSGAFMVQSLYQLNVKRI
jgi:hypothetical protein